MICSVTPFNCLISTTGCALYILTVRITLVLEHILCFPTSLPLLMLFPPPKMFSSYYYSLIFQRVFFKCFSLKHPLISASPSPIIFDFLPLNLSADPDEQSNHPGYEISDHSLIPPSSHSLFLIIVACLIVSLPFWTIGSISFINIPKCLEQALCVYSQILNLLKISETYSCPYPCTKQWCSINNCQIEYIFKKTKQRNERSFSVSPKNQTCLFMQSLAQQFEPSKALVLANQGAQEKGKNKCVGPSAEDSGAVNF